MMSVPAINPVLPPSGNQPPKVASGPPGGSVSPIGLTVPTSKISVVPPSQITSPSKPGTIGVNHSSIPLSLVHENKVNAAPVQPPPASKSPTEKPKDLSPVKPTSNGVEAPATKSPISAQATQASALASTPAPAPVPVPASAPVTAPVAPAGVGATSSTSPSPLPVQAPAPVPAPAPAPASASASAANLTVSSKPDENAAKPTTTNHSEEAKASIPSDAATAPVKDDLAQNSQAQSQTASPKTEQAKTPTTVPTPSKEPEAAAEVKLKVNNEVEKPSNVDSTAADVKPTKAEAKTPQATKRKREQKVEEIKEESGEPEKKPRRIRSQVLPYQSPLPELATFINKSLKEKDANQKGGDDKLTVFYK